jgi:hypothetical protein
LSSRTVGFPESGWRPWLSARDLPASWCGLSVGSRTPLPPAVCHRLRPRAVVTPFPGSVSGWSTTAKDRQGREPLRPRPGVTLSRDSVSHCLGECYPSFFAPTGSCARPCPSGRLQRCLGSPVFAGCRQSLLRHGPSRRYLRGSFPACLDPYPACSRSALARFFLRDFGLPRVRTGSALRNYPNSHFRREYFSGLQSFLYVQARWLARHPGDSHHDALRAWQLWLLRPTLSQFVTSPRIGYARRPNRAIDGVGTLTPQDPRPCRPLP